MATSKELSPETTLDDLIRRSVVRQPERTGAPLLPAARSAHDLANFVTGIQMLVQSLLLDEPIPRQHIVAIQRSVLHASELCEQLQKELAGEQIDLKLSEIDLGELVSTMRRYLEVIVRPGTKLTIDAAAGLPLILANSTQLQQVVNDLTNNASDAFFWSSPLRSRH